MQTITEILNKTLQPNNINFSNNIKTGFKNIDNTIGGFKKGELIVLGGRPGMGTTTFASQIAIQMAKQGTKVLYSSLDQSSEWMGNKMLSILLDIEFGKITDPVYESEVFAKKEEILTQASNLPITISDDLYKIEAFINAIESNDFDVIVIDFLQNMISNLDKHNEDIAKTIATLKEISVKKNITIIALSVISRRVEFRGGDRRPCLEDLRGSEMIEQTADKVLFIYRPEYYGITEGEGGFNLKNIMELIIGLNKNGRLINLPFKINKSFTNFTDFD